MTSELIALKKELRDAKKMRDHYKCMLENERKRAVEEIIGRDNDY